MEDFAGLFEDLEDPRTGNAKRHAKQLPAMSHHVPYNCQSMNPRFKYFSRIDIEAPTDCFAIIGILQQLIGSGPKPKGYALEY